MTQQRRGNIPSYLLIILTGPPLSQWGFEIRDIMAVIQHLLTALDIMTNTII